jgi:hypothetical protein
MAMVPAGQSPTLIVNDSYSTYHLHTLTRLLKLERGSWRLDGPHHDQSNIVRTT